MVWTDALQAAIMFLTFIGIILKGQHEAGGFWTVLDASYHTDRLELAK